MNQVRKGVSYDDYCRIDALRYSDAKGFAKSPLHARYEMLQPHADTKSTLLGHALHTAILEPERFGVEYAVGPKVDKRTTAGKAEWAHFEANHAGAIHLRGEEYDSVTGMAEAVLAHPFIQAVIGRPSHRELTLQWDENGVACKCRIDWAVELEGVTYIMDLKSTVDASVNGFARSINNFTYHAQAASYMRGLSEALPTDRPRRWLWVAVENTAPHGVAIYEPSEPALIQGLEDYLGWVGTYRACKETNTWPGYPTQLQPIDLPRYAWRNERPEAAEL